MSLYTDPVINQQATPGFAQTGNFNLTGTGILAGNLGVGGTPTYRFEVYATTGGGAESAALRNNNSGGVAGFYFFNNTNTAASGGGVAMGGTAVGAPYQNNLLLYTGGGGSHDIKIMARGTGNIDFMTTDSVASRMYVSNAGFVGVGTTPTVKFDVLDTTANDVQIVAMRASALPDTKTAFYTIGVDASTQYKSAFIAYTHNSGTPASSYAHLALRGGATGVTVNGSGHVGVGTVSPGAKFEVKGSGTGKVYIDEWGGSNAYGGIGLAGSLATGNYNFISSPGDTNLYINRPSGKDIFFRENNSTQMTLGTGGFLSINVGAGVIGTTTLSSLFTVTGLISNTGTGQQQGFLNQFTVNPQGASLAALYGAIFLPTIAGSSITIGEVASFTARVDSTAGFSGTVSSAMGVYIQNASFAGGTITNQYGVVVNDLSAGATLNYAIYTGVSSGTGKFNIYASGTASNYFAGLVGFGTNAPTRTISINAGQYAYASFNEAGAEAWVIGYEGDVLNRFVIYGGTPGGSRDYRMIFLDSGLVGVGTSPAAQFHVKSTASEVFRIESTQNNIYFNAIDSTGTHEIFSAGAGEMYMGGAASDAIIFRGSSYNQNMRIEANGTVVVGRIGAALATNATDGFVYIPTSAGTPTGTPTGWTGKVAMEYDTTNHKLWIYSGSWRSVTLA